MVFKLPNAVTLYYSSSCCDDPSPSSWNLLLLLHSCNVATIINLNVNICYVGYLIRYPSDLSDSQRCHLLPKGSQFIDWELLIYINGVWCVCVGVFNYMSHVYTLNGSSLDYNIGVTLDVYCYYFSWNRKTLTYMHLCPPSSCSFCISYTLKASPGNTRTFFL